MKTLNDNLGLQPALFDNDIEETIATDDEYLDEFEKLETRHSGSWGSLDISDCWSEMRFSMVVWIGLMAMAQKSAITP